MKPQEFVSFANAVDIDTTDERFDVYFRFACSVDALLDDSAYHPVEGWDAAVVWECGDLIKAMSSPNTEVREILENLYKEIVDDRAMARLSTMTAGLDYDFDPFDINL